MAKISDIPHRIINGGGVPSTTDIHVYEAGTTTRVPLFSDEGLTMWVPNPYNVVLGNPIPDLYHGSVGDVRVEVIDSSGTVFNDDPYDQPATVNDLASHAPGKGAAMVGAEGSGTVQDAISAYPAAAIGEGI